MVVYLKYVKDLLKTAKALTKKKGENMKKENPSFSLFLSVEIVYKHRKSQKETTPNCFRVVV